MCVEQCKAHITQLTTCMASLSAGMPQMQLATQDTVITAAAGTISHLKSLSEQRQCWPAAVAAAAGIEQQHCGSYHHHQEQQEP